MKMQRAYWIGSLAAAMIGAAVHGQEVKYETDANGVTWQVTNQVVPRSIPSTQYQSYQQNYLVPVTQYQWVPRLRGAWNPFVAPYWTQELVPVTRWENRTGTVQMPVTTYHTVSGQVTSRVPVSVAAAPAAGAIAPNAIGPPPAQTNVVMRPVEGEGSRYGGKRQEDSPPRSSGVTSYR